MNRRKFINLFGLGIGLTQCTDDMQFPQLGILGSRRRNIPSGDMILVIGDSVGRGNSDAVGLAPDANTFYQFDDDTNLIVPVGATDLLEVIADGATGSQWPRFGREYFNATNRSMTIVQTGVGGSGWYHGTLGGFSWYTNGTCYSNAITKYNQAVSTMSALGVTPVLKGVFINLGINDSVQFSHTLSYTYLTSLIDRINTDLSTPKIYITLPYRTGTFTNTENDRLYIMRTSIKQLTLDYANVIGVGDNSSFQMWGSSTYWQSGGGAADFHLSYAGNDQFGKMIARAVAMDTAAYEKETITITSAMFSELNTNRKTLINNFITDQKADGNWDLLQRLHIYISSGDNKDRLISWRLNRSAFIASGATFSTGIVTDGSTNHISNFWAQGESIGMDYSTDFIWGVKTGTTVPTPGVSGALFGVRETVAGGLINLNQNATNLAYHAGAATVKSVPSEASIEADTLYAVARNAGNMYLIKDTSVIDTQAQAAVALGTTSGRNSTDGARNNNGTIDQRMNVECIYGFTGKYVGFNLTTFYDDMEYLLAHWND